MFRTTELTTSFPSHRAMHPQSRVNNVSYSACQAVFLTPQVAVLISVRTFLAKGTSMHLALKTLHSSTFMLNSRHYPAFRASDEWWLHPLQNREQTPSTIYILSALTRKESEQLSLGNPYAGRLYEALTTPKELVKCLASYGSNLLSCFSVVSMMDIF